MGFEQFGIVSFTSDTKAADFLTYLEEGRVMATRCKGCGRIYFPPRVECADCFSCDVEWFDLSDQGKLLTYSVVNYGPTGFEDDTPYRLALAEFGGVQVFGRLDKRIEAGKIKVGMSVKLAAVKLADEKLSYHFEVA